jgi:hypothetical protein
LPKKIRPVLLESVTYRKKYKHYIGMEPGMQGIGKMMLIGGIVLAVAGAFLMFSPRVPFLGRLPGDIVVKRENFSFYFPLMTSIVLSVLLSLVLWLIRRFGS